MSYYIYEDRNGNLYLDKASGLSTIVILVVFVASASLFSTVSNIVMDNILLCYLIGTVLLSLNLIISLVTAIVRYVRSKNSETRHYLIRNAVAVFLSVIINVVVLTPVFAFIWIFSQGVGIFTIIGTFLLGPLYLLIGAILLLAYPFVYSNYIRDMECESIKGTVLSIIAMIAVASVVIIITSFILTGPMRNEFGNLLEIIEKSLS